MIERRKLITLLAAAAWPLSARAQQGERVRREDMFKPYLDLSKVGLTSYWP